MKKAEFRTLEMTRRIRAEHAKQLRDATPEDRIRFYREKARWVERRRPSEDIREPSSGAVTS